MVLSLVLLTVFSSVAAAGNDSKWIDLFTPPFFVDCPVPFITGLSCVSRTACFVSGGSPSSGMSVYKSTDEHFRNVDRLTVNTPVPIDLLLAVGMQDETHGVAGGLGLGVGGTYWTVDGKTFNSSLEVGVVTTQAVYALGGGKYAFVGQSLGKQGVAVSHDGGITFRGHWWPKGFSDDAPARYGAFPSATTWYVTGGEWPQSNDTAGEGVRAVSWGLSVDTRRGRFVRREVTGATAAGNGTYTAVIAKTTDGGATWTKQYHGTGKFYFNQISCATTEVCMAVAEGFAKDGGSPGARVWGTTDGATWKELYVFGADEAGSVMAVTMLSATEAWVAAGVSKGSLGSGAVMLHTVDGGRTWEASPKLNGVGAVMGMSFVEQGQVGYAAAVTVAQDSTVLAFGVSPPPPGPAPVPAGAFVQEQCSDANCTAGCREARFQQGQCLQVTGGGSAQVECTSMGASIETKMFTTPDCTGTPKTESQPTAKCLPASSGGYFENLCPQQAPAVPPTAGAPSVLWRA